MSRMPKTKKINYAAKSAVYESGKERKRAAFERMKKLRKAAMKHPIEDVETARGEALKEKYGAFI